MPKDKDFIRYAIESGCRFRYPFTTWYTYKDRQLYFIHNKLEYYYPYSINVILLYGDVHGNISLHPEDEAKLKFNKKIEDLIG